ncbi:DUF6276 family protein [Halobaculum sp. CBA1158]|uniref:DUF6276 family protein n=1 Tax=Halobaculum sp. CBA1158 TaxID=2904243 RepID=UPI001F252DFE|nr:DUF6276 family protein [Halobaculum sp. CBA1158]UIP00746.1 DUF6276 family protein [Halobaculum sp. CBA1158]
MVCPDCEAADPVAFAVPSELRDHAPATATVASICPNCLSVASASETATDGDPEFSRVHESFPAGDAGVAFALLIGTLPSIALRKSSARALREAAERDGADVSLAFDRLIAAVHDAEVVPTFDLERRVRQLNSLLGS